MSSVTLSMNIYQPNPYPQVSWTRKPKFSSSMFKFYQPSFEEEDFDLMVRRIKCPWNSAFGIRIDRDIYGTVMDIGPHHRTTSRHRVAVLWFGTADSCAALIPTANKNPSNQIKADQHIHRDVAADKGTQQEGLSRDSCLSPTEDSTQTRRYQHLGPTGFQTSSCAQATAPMKSTNVLNPWHN